MRTRSHAAVLFLLALCAAGLFLRLHSYSANRSLWADEAMLALNITGRTFHGLLGTLDFDQAAPVAFLLLEKAVASLLGGSDCILRLVPLLAGLASVPLMFFVSRAYGGRLSAFFALGLFALSPRLVYFSSELKQYSTDVLVALALLLVASQPLAERAGPRAFLALGAAASLAVWASHPSVFVSASVILTAIVIPALRRDSRRLRWSVGAAAAWCASLGLCYAVNLRHLGENPGLRSYWSSSFAPMPPWSDPGWYMSALVGLLRDPARLPATWVTVAILVLGALSLAVRRRPLALVLSGTFLLTLAASAAGRYPFSGRLLLFLVPLLLLLLGEGVERVGTLLRRANRPLACVGIVLLCLYFVRGPAVASWRSTASHPAREEIKEVMAHVRDNRRGGDLIYVYHGAAPAFQFYAAMYGFSGGDYSVGVPARQGRAQYLEDADGFRGASRVWFIFSHYGWSWKISDRRLLLSRLDEIGERMDAFESRGASSYLYDLRETLRKAGPEGPGSLN